MRKIVISLLVIAAFASVAMLGYREGRKAAISRVKVQTDTIYQTRFIMAQNAPQIALRKVAQIPVVFPLHDTIRMHADTAAIILDFVQNIQQDTAGRFTAYVSGLAYGDIVPQLDSILLTIPERTIVETRIEERKTRPRFSLGIQAGYGMTIAQQPQFAPYVGIGLQYNLLSWGYK